MNTLPPALGGLESIISRYDMAVARRNLWASLYRECYRYAIPSRQLFTEYSPGQEKENELFDSTAVQAVLEFASRLQSTICPSWRSWSLLEPGPNLPREMRESSKIRDSLQEQTDILFSYLNHSNFTLKSHEAFIDLAAGTGAICESLNDRQDGLTFDCVPIARLAIEDSPYGSIETVFEDKKMAIRSIKRLYDGKVTIPQEWAREKDHIEKDFCQAVIYEPKARKYHLVMFAKAPKSVMYYRDMDTSSPYIVFRWTVVPGEVFGRGPVLNALADIRTINVVVEYMLKAAALNIYPPMTGVSDGVLNPYTAVIAPNTIIPVMSNDNSNPTLRPLNTQFRPDLSQFLLAELRMNIRKALIADPRRTDGPVQSATEVLVEDREFVQAIGSAFGRVQSEFIEKVVARSVYLLQKLGVMAKIKVDGKEVTLKHTSPLARAQDTEDLQNLGNASALAMNAVGPEMYQLTVKTNEIAGYIFRKAGIPDSLIRTEEEVQAKIEEGKAAMQQAQAEQPAMAA